MATKKIICALHEKNTSQTGLFGIGQDSLVFAGESPSATLEIWSKIVHCELYLILTVIHCKITYRCIYQNVHK